MKTWGKIFLLCSTVLFIASCSKLQESPDPGTASNGTTTGGTTGGNTGGSTTIHFTCKIDGVAYEAGTFEGKVVNNSLSLNSFPQAAWSYPNVGISAPASIAVGTYSPGQGVTVIYMEGADPSQIWGLMPSGTVIITSHNTSTKEIKGTFDCTVKNLMGGGSKQLTDGSFYMKY